MGKKIGKIFGEKLKKIADFLKTEKKIGDEKILILPQKSVGVAGDARTFKNAAIFFGEKFLPENFAEKNFEILENSKNLENNFLKNGEKNWENFWRKIEKIVAEKINSCEKISRGVILLGKNFSGKIEKIAVAKNFLTPGRAKILRRADEIVEKNLREKNFYEKTWQFPVILAPIFFNDCGSESVILRPVDSIDAMSASLAPLPLDFFWQCAAEILRDEKISAVFLDATPKPPGTIEWE